MAQTVEIVGYELWEVSPTAKADQHYRVGIFEDADYANTTAELMNKRPVIHGSWYYTLAILSTDDRAKRRI